MPKFVVDNKSRFCDSTCGICAREFFAWLKSRMYQMSVVLEGNGTSFASAAAGTEQTNMATAVATTAPDCLTLSSALADLALALF